VKSKGENWNVYSEEQLKKTRVKISYLHKIKTITEAQKMCKKPLELFSYQHQLFCRWTDIDKNKVFNVR
jgi:hypothetical protein